MANELTITVGNNTARRSVPGTNAKVNAIILRFLVARGVSTEGLTPTQIGEAYLGELVKFTAEMSARVQRKQLMEANYDAIEATVAADNSM